MQRSESASAYFPGLCLLVLAVEAETAILLLQHKVSAGMTLHALVTCVLLCWTVSAPHLRDNRFAALLVLLTAVTGPFGAFICLVAFGGCRYCSGSVAAPGEWISEFLAEEEAPANDNDGLLMRNLEEISEGGVEPFQDILQHGTVRQKQLAIARITHHFRPRFGALLVAATRDTNAAVRVQAATALAALERRFMTQYIALERTVANKPAGDVARLRLAALYDDYAHAGILDEYSCRLLREKAITLYEAHPDYMEDTALRIRLARLYLRQDNPERACTLLRPLVSGKAPMAAVSWYMESLFRLRRFAEMRTLARDYRNREGTWSRDAETADVPVIPLLFGEHYHAA